MSSEIIAQVFNVAGYALQGRIEQGQPLVALIVVQGRGSCDSTVSDLLRAQSATAL